MQEDGEFANDVFKAVKLDEQRRRFNALLWTTVAATSAGVGATIAAVFSDGAVNISDPDPLSLASVLTAAVAVVAAMLVLLEFGRRQRFQAVTQADSARSPASQAPEFNHPIREAKRRPGEALGWAHFASVATDIRRRLSDEIDALGFRAALNLAIGGVMAVAGLIVLAWLAATTAVHISGSTLSPMNYWGAFMAKLGLSITVNLISLFFFSTYRRSLSDIKYLHNELTNVESRIVALLWTDQNRPDDMERVLDAWVSTERNFVLKKGETTADFLSKELDTREISLIAQAVLSAAEKRDKE